MDEGDFTVYEVHGPARCGTTLQHDGLDTEVAALRPFAKAIARASSP